MCPPSLARPFRPVSAFFAPLCEINLTTGLSIYKQKPHLILDIGFRLIIKRLRLNSKASFSDPKILETLKWYLLVLCLVCDFNTDNMGNTLAHKQMKHDNHSQLGLPDKGCMIKGLVI